MAHAGTPTDLAQQPATSTNGLWQALLAAIVLMAVVAASVFIGTNVARIGSAVPAANHRIEAQRGPTTAAAAMIYAGRIQAQRGPTTAAAALIYVGDASYDQVEKNRGAATLSGIVAPDRRFDELMLAPAADSSYTQVEKNRGGAFSAATDDSYTQVEKNRGGALTAAGTSGTVQGFGPGTSGFVPDYSSDTSGTVPAFGPGTSGFVPDYGPGTSGTVPNYGPGQIQGHRGAEIDQ